MNKKSPAISVWGLGRVLHPKHLGYDAIYWGLYTTDGFFEKEKRFISDSPSFKGGKTKNGDMNSKGKKSSKRVSVGRGVLTYF